MVTISGGDSVGVFSVSSGFTFTVKNLIIAHGLGGFDGGGIANNGLLTVTNSTFSGNSAFVGGGIANIANNGTVTVTNSTFSGNDGAVGGAIVNNNGTVTVTNSTFSGNDGAVGGAIFNSSGTLTVTNSTFDSGDSCDGAITDGGHNLDDGTTCDFSAANGSLNREAHRKTVRRDVYTSRIAQGQSRPESAPPGEKGRTKPVPAW